ncbi:MAG: TIGR03960 family B12-binding radical SAM protein [Candidatus Cloacimonadota bacterium]|nr:TIGR03960 family B12-binding radical SAM protein [Candidatus Cloacimonadota bacterium]
MKKVEFEHLLAAVEKPARYIDAEINKFGKIPKPQKVNFCLAFPDTYEVGFSHLGIKILYSILNKQEDTVCDRTYAPWPDFGKLLNKEGLSLFGWESNIALYDFDVIGFTLQSELTYTNLLYILDLAQIPLVRKKRTQEHPIIIAGGPCASNPKPLSQFVDLFLIGEGEEAILEIKDVVKRNKNKTKHILLEEAAQIDGCYVPDYTKKTVRARKFMGFSESHDLHKPQLVPWMQPVHNRYVAEIMRGCSRGCRFCHAGMFYRPVRERQPQNIIEDLLQEVKEFGWEEVALTSLSSSDYTCIKPLLQELFNRLDTRKTRLSLPSLRVDSLDDKITDLMNELRQTGFTIAPEAGSQRLRDIINKNISETEILEVVEIAKRNGWRLVKLYFMIGLPYEKWEDIEAIVDLVEKIIQKSQKRIKLNITISPFVPKVFTPFQWAAMASKEELLQKAIFLKRSLKRYKFVNLRYHEIDSSILEVVLGRGGTEVGDLLEKAYRNGALFDGWNEWFDNNKWLKAFEQCDMEINSYLSQINTSLPLPWEDVDLGISKDFLISEWKNAKVETITPDCRVSECTECGICSNRVFPVYKKKFEASQSKKTHAKIHNGEDHYYRIFYSKLGKLRFVAHLDMLRSFQKILKKSDLPLRYSQGYNPHPLLSLGPPLPVGVESESEYFDFSLQKSISLDKIKNKIAFPSQLEFKDVIRLLSKKERSMDYFQLELVEVSNLPTADWKQRVKKFNNSPSWPFQRERKGKIQHKDLKNLVIELKLEDNKLNILKKVSGASIFNVLESIFKIKRNDTNRLRIVRLKLLHSSD